VPALPTAAADELRRFAHDILTSCGLSADDAAAAAAGLISANLRGVDSHGVLRLMQYARALAEGAINPRPRVRFLQRRGATALIDADGGYGFRPTNMAMDAAVEAARRFGIGVAGVRNSHHFGMAAAYVLRAAEAGVIGWLLTTTEPLIAPPGGLAARVGNNPYAVGIPGDPPVVLDMALSTVAFGRIRLAAAEGRSIPEGWGYDRRGRPTTDAAEALAAGLLAPIGGHKGYGLSVTAEVLAGVLTGSPFGLAASAHARPQGGVGHLAMAIDPAFFVEPAEFAAGVARLREEIRSVPRAEGVEAVYLPGDIERRTLEQRTREGIPLTDELAAQLEALADRLGVARPAWRR
jgi:L-2-hydroxycarboxylate dehydrogenase (NAD+)